MDKRINKTNEKIYEAFKNILQRIDYNDIKIQDVLDESKVSRSTFYAHYKTKEDLLKSITSSIFDHVFSHSLKEEHSHDFSKSSIFDYKHFITHIYYHFLDEKELIHAIFLSQSKDIFLNDLRDEIKDFATSCVENNFIEKKNLPDIIIIKNFIENFILLLKYWDENDYADSPTTLTNYLFELCR